MRHYIGLDVAMKATFICVMSEKGKIMFEGKEQTDPALLAIHMQKWNSEKIGIECSSLTPWLVKELKKQGLPVFAIDSRKMATIIDLHRNKTDKNDARSIADAMRSNLYQEVRVKSSKEQEISCLLGSRRILINVRTMAKNAIRGLLKPYGIKLAGGVQAFIEDVESRKSDLGEYLWISFEGLLETVKKSTEGIEKLTKILKKIALEDEDVKRLMQVPGVDLITSLAYKVEVGHVERFEDSTTVGAYFGLTPTGYSSGEIKRQGRVSKRGNKEVRYLLVEAATVLLTRCQKWSKLKAWGLKIMRKKGLRKAAVAVARKLAVIMHRMLVTKTDFIWGDNKKQTA